MWESHQLIAKQASVRLLSSQFKQMIGVSAFCGDDIVICSFLVKETVLNQSTFVLDEDLSS
jgi:hypothetical protein